MSRCIHEIFYIPMKPRGWASDVGPGACWPSGSSHVTRVRAVHKITGGRLVWPNYFATRVHAAFAHEDPTVGDTLQRGGRGVEQRRGCSHIRRQRTDSSSSRVVSTKEEGGRKKGIRRWRVGGGLVSIEVDGAREVVEVVKGERNGREDGTKWSGEKRVCRGRRQEPE